MIDYYKWIGLPYRFGANPDDGEGADCLILAHKILDSVHAPCPPLQAKWLQLAREEKWGELQVEWDKYMIPVEQPKLYDLHMKRSDGGEFSIGTVVDDGLVFVSHRKGVAWIPLSLVKGNFWRVRHAAS